MIGKKVKLLKAYGQIPAGTEALVIDQGEEFMLGVRCCGLDFVVEKNDVEVIESDGITAGQSVGTGGAPAVGENTSDGQGDVSGVCSQCGAVLRQADTVS